MRYTRFIIAIIAISIMHINTCRADDDSRATKQRKISGHFYVQPGDKLEVDNTYGLVHINSWNKDEVSVDIVVTVKAATESKAEEAIDRINITSEQNVHGQHRVYYKTSIAEQKNNNSLDISINYTINAPHKIALALTNKYGDVYIDDHSGPIDVNIAYGALSMKDISGPGKNINVTYGNGTISSIEDAVMSIAYSNFTINKGRNIDVKNKYGNLTIDNVKQLQLDEKYGNVDLGQVGSMAGSVEYANLAVDQLSKNADLDLKYCSKVDFRSITAQTSLLKINAAYSNISLHAEPGLNMAVDMETTYGDMQGKFSFKQLVIERKEHNSGSHCTGNLGNGAGKMQVNVRYGNIIYK